MLRFRGGDLLGIVNGIDAASWNPATDPALPARYSATDLAGKAVCKRALQERLRTRGGTQDADFSAWVSRFARGKGLDLLAEILPKVLADMQVQFAVLRQW